MPVISAFLAMLDILTESAIETSAYFLLREKESFVMRHPLLFTPTVAVPST
jgi:hypothetical protein